LVLSNAVVLGIQTDEGFCEQKKKITPDVESPALSYAGDD